MQETIESLRAENERLKARNAELEELNRQLISREYWSQEHNERKAGRKPSIMERTKDEIRMYRANGKTYREISKLTGVSLGEVCNICK